MWFFRKSGIRRLTSETCYVASKLVSDRRLEHTLGNETLNSLHHCRCVTNHESLHSLH